MPHRNLTGREEQRRAYKEFMDAQYKEAILALATSLHNKFCDADLELVGGWDEAVILHVIKDFMELPSNQYAAMIRHYILTE